MSKLVPGAAAALAVAAAVFTGCGSETRPAPPLPRPLTAQQLIDRASEGVVAIKVATERGEGIGTGWVVSPQQIMTAAHVVSGAQDIKVRFKDGAVVPARIVGESVCNDRALLELTQPQPNMTVLPLADAAPLDRNRRLDLLHYGSVAVSDFGSEEMTTSPLTVANPRIRTPDLGPGFPALTDLIQLQGVVPGGASGGAILDGNGRVSGMVVLGETQQSQAYALPIGQLRQALDGLRKGDRTDSLGLELTPISEIDLTELFRNDPDYGVLNPEVLASAVATVIERDGTEGLFIAGVVDSGPSQNQLAYGDMITDVNGVRVRSMADLCGVVQSAGAGDELTVRGYRINAGTTIDDLLRPWTSTVRLNA